MSEAELRRLPKPDERVDLGMFSFPANLTAFLHDEQPSRDYGWLNGRMTLPVDFRIDADAVSFPIVRKGIPTFMTVWYGERLFMKGGIDIEGRMVLGPKDRVNITGVGSLQVLSVSGYDD